MLKIIRNDAWDFDTPLVSVVKVSSRGLVGQDKRDFVKRASADLFDKVASLETKPGEVLIHAIALGTTEKYGPNRNGDGFTKRACAEYHNTFVSDARFYRNHKNTDPEQSYGIVKASSFNEPMGRVELIIALNGDEKAAKANGGLVADKEMTKLASNDDIALSMAARVDFDVCSCCGHKSSNRDEYCTDITKGGMCKAGGLKHNIGKMASVDGKLHQLHADNPYPTFIDISNVYIPADRTAYSNGIIKRGSANEIVCGAELAEMYGVQEKCFMNKAASYSMAPMSDSYKHTLSCLCNAVNSFHTGEMWNRPDGYLSVMDTQPLTNVKMASYANIPDVLKVLADNRICLTPTQFIQLNTGEPFEKCAFVGEIIAPASNEYFMSMLHRDNSFNPFKFSDIKSDKLNQWVGMQKCARWCDVSRGVKQAAKNTFNRPLAPKLTPEQRYSLAEDSKAKSLAESYAFYKAAFIDSLPANQKQAAANLLVGRDYIYF